jgi:hypothetical protein
MLCQVKLGKFRLSYFLCDVMICLQYCTSSLSAHHLPVACTDLYPFQVIKIYFNLTKNFFSNTLESFLFAKPLSLQCSLLRFSLRDSLDKVLSCCLFVRFSLQSSIVNFSIQDFLHDIFTPWFYYHVFSPRFSS